MTMSESEGRLGVVRVWSRGERSVSQKGRVGFGGGRNWFCILAIESADVPNTGGGGRCVARLR